MKRNDGTTVALTLGEAILRARDHARDTGEAMTVALCGHGDASEFCTIPSHEYALLREHGQSGDIAPLVSFLPRGGIDVHRASFEPIASALLQHERF